MNATPQTRPTREQADRGVPTSNTDGWNRTGRSGILLVLTLAGALVLTALLITVWRSYRPVRGC